MRDQFTPNSEVVTFEAGGALTAHYVASGTTSTANPKCVQSSSAKDSDLIGIILYTKSSGDLDASVLTSGYCAAKFGSVSGITKPGQPLTTDSSGRVVLASGTSGDVIKIVGFTYKIPSAENAIVEIQVSPQYYTVS
jgi:hypothetical protein